MIQIAWKWGRLAASILTLVVVVWRLGTGPFLDGLRMVDPASLAAAASIAVLTTLCCAWRWKTVAGGLGIGVSLPAAVIAYYRSQFLNLTLPGGVVGDVHRGISHGREVNDVSRALRAVILERSAGQAVQIVVTVVILLVLPSPVQSSMPSVAIGMLGTVLCIVLMTRARTGPFRSASSRLRRAAVGDVARGALGRRAWLGIVLTSAVVVAGHAAMFLIAARTAGTAASPSQLLPIAFLVMAAMVLPSAGGWGPREGVAAWAFGAAGLGAAQGVATGVVYGVMALVASSPGAAVLALTWVRRARLPKLPDGTPRRALGDEPAHA